MLSFLLRWSALLVVLAVGGLLMHGMLNREQFEDPSVAPESASESKGTQTLAQRVVHVYKTKLQRLPSESELRGHVDRLRKKETPVTDADIEQEVAEAPPSTKEEFVDGEETPAPPLRQSSRRDPYTEEIEERGRDRAKQARKTKETAKEKWTQEDLVLLPGMQWTLPQPHEPICRTEKRAVVEPVVDRTALIGTLLQ